MSENIVVCKVRGSGVLYTKYEDFVKVLTDSRTDI